MLRFLFMGISTLLVLCLSVYKIFIHKRKRTPKISTFVSFITGLILIYSLLSFIYCFFVFGIANKILLLVLAVTPFVIGRLATYKSENFYCWFQIWVVFSGLISAFAMD